ncbi:hypothetical protein ATG98_3559 [Marinobacter sp. LV10R520-4]|nr:hypothetical protein ATG98_3559 [Marinobacter sp. LV10R520-4]
MVGSLSDNICRIFFGMDKESVRDLHASSMLLAGQVAIVQGRQQELGAIP